ncbi:VOC family protein [Litchfieldia alkalitelluris]|uniref:VOC family protein n=1 Tax=Litchfieldia alkalitelluris TaxID=304268 RepID=UPI000996CD1E|nr:VOC family protein [Litchfieldia alkalitelluris]
MSINVYLVFNRNCREAVEFYAEVFETEKPNIQSFGEMPPNPDYPLPEGAKNLVLHTQLSIDGSTVMFSDNFPGSPFVQGNNFNLTVVNNDMDQIRSWFNKLKEGGSVKMELQETFWSKLYGQLTDKFGIQWQLSHGSNEK